MKPSQQLPLAWNRIQCVAVGVSVHLLVCSEQYSMCFDTRVRTFVCEGRIWNLNLFELLLNYLLVVPPCLLLYLFLRISILFLNAVAFVSVFDIVAESYPRTRSII